jgi:hypothetical protein
MNLLTDVAASASGDARVRAVFDDGRYRGTTWRIQAGVRPFTALGLYLDAGYAKLDMTGTFTLTDSGVRELVAIGGKYTGETSVHFWLIEFGYQAEFADRVVVGTALGLMGAFDSTTSFARADGSAPHALAADVARQTDSAIEEYGFIPTLTLRVGFDLL